MLKSIPPPGKDQIAAIGSALEGVVVGEGLSEEDVQVRRGVLALMQSIIAPVLPGKPVAQHNTFSTFYAKCVCCVLFLKSNMSFMYVFAGSKLRLYGSSCTRFGFKDSDVNIDIQASSSVSNCEVTSQS